ncbi:hypothetical protein H4K35_08705 [Myroides sp. NP-2]|uniref:hypothetical protein n=1 Tax=Myroides sp. NP-2 TaxID=2759945 RepID=UPI0015FC251D|nr:hypothetical protein [Myroides sp. NP-2]MBB1150208.1 hypothetical protein [Myroides sp. NP-2]
MKKILIYLVVSSSLLGCSNDYKTSEHIAPSSSKVFLKKDKSVGQMHNDLLHLFEQAERAGQQLVDPTKNELSDAMISIINNYFLEQGSEPNVFSEMLQEIPDITQHLNLLVQSTDNLQLLREQLQAFYTTSLPITVQTHALTIFDATSKYEGTTSISSELDKIATAIKTDESLSSEYQKQLLDAISIAEYSNTYWHPSNSSILDRRNLFSYYAGADTAGALAMIQSGAVATASTLTIGAGGWGGLAVLVGGAAFSSFMASR